MRLFLCLCALLAASDALANPFKVMGKAWEMGTDAAKLGAGVMVGGAALGMGAMAGGAVLAGSATVAAAGYGARAAVKTAELGASTYRGAREIASGIEEEEYKAYGTVEERAVKSEVGGGAVFGQYPQIENVARMRGTYKGRPISVEDVINAEMSGRFSGKGNIMEAASGSNEYLSQDRKTRTITGIRVEGVGPEVMEVTQRVVAKGPDYGKIEFSVNGVLEGKFYEEFRRLPNGEVEMKEIWNKDKDSVIRSKTGLLPAVLAKVHSEGTLGQARNIAKKIGQGYSGGLPEDLSTEQGAQKALDAAKAACDSPAASTGRALYAARKQTGAACDLQKVRRLQAAVQAARLRKMAGKQANSATEKLGQSKAARRAAQPAAKSSAAASRNPRSRFSYNRQVPGQRKQRQPAQQQQRQPAQQPAAPRGQYQQQSQQQPARHQRQQQQPARQQRQQRSRFSYNQGR